MIDEEVASLTKRSRHFKITKGDTVFMQGDPSDAIFFLSKGVIKISRINSEGRKLTLELIEPGNFFGELCLAEEKERRSIAEAMVDSFCYEIEKEHIESYMEKRPNFARKLLQIIGNRRLEMENLLEDMAFMDISSRVIALLLKYAENNVVKIPLTHQDIADLTGSTRVSVSRCIAKLRKEGLITTDESTIRLANNEILHSHVQYSSSASYSYREVL
jgi:CRP/FNR family transcriptional regulator